MFRNPINSINPNTNNPGLGGASPLTRTFLSIYNSFQWSKVMYFIIGIIFILLSYYVYTKWIRSNATYNANRENINNTEDKNEGVNGTGTKQAELMLFYVDWCPHCKTAKPEWDNLKTTYENKTINGYSIIFTEHNCTTETSEVEELMNKYKIEGYPTIKLLKDNQIIEYDAKPTKSTMEQFLNTVL
jgi:thiol-disulfide isomerase/thioredoxin